MMHCLRHEVATERLSIRQMHITIQERKLRENQNVFKCGFRILVL